MRIYTITTGKAIDSGIKVCLNLQNMHDAEATLQCWINYNLLWWALLLFIQAALNAFYLLFTVQIFSRDVTRKLDLYKLRRK
jgi:hypothetical protein